MSADTVYYQNNKSGILRINVGEEPAKTHGASEVFVDFLTCDQAFVFFAAVDERKKRNVQFIRDALQLLECNHEAKSACVSRDVNSSLTSVCNYLSQVFFNR